MKPTRTSAREFLRSRLWPIPILIVLIAFAAGVGLPSLDSWLDSRPSAGVTGWLFSGDVDAARSLLTTIAASLITVTALTFSLTVVTLQLASSQFSPRLLRTFTSDLFVQTTLGLFLGTFTYALTVLRAIGGGSTGDFVPQVSVSLAFGLGVGSVAVLVVFLAHLTAQLRVETMLDQVHRESSRTLRGALLERENVTAAGALVPLDFEDALTLSADRDGFVTRIDESGLLSLAVAADLLIRLDVCAGDIVVAGTRIGAFRMADASPLTEQAAAQITSRITRHLATGPERTAAQDIGFGLRQLSDVANKALSPGINDPTTAIHALGHVSAVLGELTGYDLGPRLLRDEHDRPRVLLHRPEFADLLDLGVSQPRRYGAGDPQVLTAVLGVLADLSQRASEDHLGAISAQLERTRLIIERQEFDDIERADLDQRVEHLAMTLAQGR